MGRSHSHVKARQPVRKRPKANSPSLLDRVLISERLPATDEKKEVRRERR